MGHIHVQIILSGVGVDTDKVILLYHNPAQFLTYCLPSLIQSQSPTFLYRTATPAQTYILSFSPSIFHSFLNCLFSLRMNLLSHLSRLLTNSRLIGAGTMRPHIEQDMHEL